MKTIEDLLEETAKRHSLGGAEKHKLFIYGRSAATRLEECRKVLSEIESHVLSVATDSTGGRTKEVNYLASIFCVLAYSSLDIVAHVANAVHPFTADERKVFFKALLERGVNKHASTANAAEQIRKRRYFKDLEALRHCTLHRRTLNLMRVMVAPQYVNPDSTQPTGLGVAWHLPKDPADPECAAAGKPLLDEFSRYLRQLESDLRTFLKAL